MLKSFLKNKANFGNKKSLSYKLRKKRFDLFLDLTKKFNKPIKILDIGGTIEYWDKMGLKGDKNYQITILNLEKQKSEDNINFIQGNASQKLNFEDKEFDIVHSNSVIEHINTWEGQKIMAEEIQRSGKSFFVQTPNYYFPIEPHYLCPFFQFLPLFLRTFLLKHFNLGWHKKIKDKKKAVRMAKRIKLLTKKEMKKLFPDSTLYKEKIFGLTKSFIVYK